MGRGGHTANIAQQLDVRLTWTKVVVADDGPVGLTAELSVLGPVNVIVKPGLEQLWRVFEIVEQLLLGNVEQADFDVLAEIGPIDEEPESAPSGFQLLEL